MTKPKSIELFSKLYLIGAALALTNLIIHYDRLRSLAILKGGSPAGPLIALLIMLPFLWVIWFFITHRASNVVKWILVISAVYQPINWYLNGSLENGLGTLHTIVMLLSSAFDTCAVAVLFSSDAKNWFRTKGKMPDPKVFS